MKILLECDCVSYTGCDDNVVKVVLINLACYLRNPVLMFIPVKVLYTGPNDIDKMKSLENNKHLDIKYYRVNADASRNIAEHGFWFIVAKPNTKEIDHD